MTAPPVVVAPCEGPEPIPYPTATALLLGGAVAAGTAFVGLWLMAGGSYPYAFGLDLNGDRGYPFPFPEAVWIGGVVAVVGLALGGGLLATARGRRAGRWAGLALLALVVALVALWVTATSDQRACGTDSYTGRQHCTSAERATIRDLVIFDGLPVLAFGALALAPASRRGPGEPELPSQPV